MGPQLGGQGWCLESEKAAARASYTKWRRNMRRREAVCGADRRGQAEAVGGAVCGAAVRQRCGRLGPVHGPVGVDGGGGRAEARVGSRSLVREAFPLN